MLTMKKRVCFFLIASLYIMSGVYAASSRLFLPYKGAHRQDKGQKILQSPTHVQVPFGFDTKEKGPGSMENAKTKEEATYKRLSRLGSRPPNCEHKCGRCVPCIAIQVPTTTDQLGLQYANYEPEGWKCKCGTSFFNP